MVTQEIKIKSYYRNINLKDEDILRIQLYGIIAEIILSKVFFEKNEDIKDLLDVLHLQYKAYVMKSRTNILARIIRDIEVMDIVDLLGFHERLKRFLFVDIYNGNYRDKKKNKSKNIIDDTLKQFKRGDEN